MGNLYRFVEPVLLFLLKKKGRSYGYELAAELREHALTDASIEAAALYKTLRQLEQNDCVTSEWDVHRQRAGQNESIASRPAARSTSRSGSPFSTTWPGR